MSDLSSTEKSIFTAARWLVENRHVISSQRLHVVPELQSRFGLSPKQACEAIRHANAAEQQGA